MTEVQSKKNPAWLPVALDYVPLLIFFLGFKIWGIMSGTALFMAAILIAVVLSKCRLNRISPMMGISAILVIVFGGLTLWLHDPVFIQLKPTIIYTILSAMLFIGLMRGQPLLKFVLEHGYDGLSDKGWMILSRNWAYFFLTMAIFNEVVRAMVSFDMWLTIKVWGITILSLIFAAAHVPMLMRNGLGQPETKEPAPQ